MYLRYLNTVYFKISVIFLISYSIPGLDPEINRINVTFKLNPSKPI